MFSQKEFLESTRHVAVYGLKRDNTGFAHEVVKAITSVHTEVDVTAIHPESDKIGSFHTVQSAQELSPPADSAIVVLGGSAAHGAIDDIARGSIRKVWLVQNAATPTNLDHAESLGMQVTKGCPILFLEGQGFPHNFHRALAKLFGRI